MKVTVPFRCASVLLFALFMTACAMFHPRTGRDVLAGTWSNTLGTVWTIKADGTFDVDLNHNGQSDAWGKYTISDDSITLLRSGGISPKHCDGQGVYRFSRSNNTLRFTLVSDDCKLRRKNVLLPWALK
jgi:hypothetical protein